MNRDLKTRNGRIVTVELPEAGTGPSCFLVSLPKAGSSMYYQIMRPVCERAGLPFFSLPNELVRLGLPQNQIVGGIESVFAPNGYAFGGFRGIGAPFTLPPFASGRTVALVRDPRDMVTSLYFSEAYSHAPPGAAVSNVLRERFEKRRAAARAEAIDDYAIRQSTQVTQWFADLHANLDRMEHRTYRYEDIIFDKQRWIAEIVEHLALPIAAANRTAIVARHDFVPDTEDAGKHMRKVTPGDHRDKLRSETIATLDGIFATILARYGY